MFIDLTNSAHQPSATVRYCAAAMRSTPTAQAIRYACKFEILFRARAPAQKSCAASRPFARADVTLASDERWSTAITMTRETETALKIDLLYLDLSHCDRCQGAKGALDRALDALAPALAALGRDVERRDILVTSAEHAAAEGFVASPTVRVDGVDIQPEAHQSRCDTCGDLCGCADGVDCRLWAWDGALHASPPVALLVERIMAHAAGRAPAVAGDAAASDAGVRAFFAAGGVGSEPQKESADAGCCGTGCCG